MGREEHQCVEHQAQSGNDGDTDCLPPLSASTDLPTKIRDTRLQRSGDQRFVRIVSEKTPNPVLSPTRPSKVTTEQAGAYRIIDLSFRVARDPPVIVQSPDVLVYLKFLWDTRQVLVVIVVNSYPSIAEQNASRFVCPHREAGAYIPDRRHCK